MVDENRTLILNLLKLVNNLLKKTNYLIKFVSTNLLSFVFTSLKILTSLNALFAI